MKQNILSFLLVAAACTGGFAFATETENLNMQVLPAPGKVVFGCVEDNAAGDTRERATHWAGLSERRFLHE